MLPAPARVLDDMPESVEEVDVASFMSQLHSSHIQGLDDLDYDSASVLKKKIPRRAMIPMWRRSKILWILKQAPRDQGHKTTAKMKILLRVMLG